MACATGPYRQLTIWVILSAMLGMPWSLSLKGMQPTAKMSLKGTHSTANVSLKGTHSTANVSLKGMQPTAKNNTHFTGEMYGDNVKVYAPQSPQPVGSLILLMGINADLSWTMTQWWYLHPAWAPSDQEWCQGDCYFTDEDKARAARLTNNLRIVDAVGTIRLAKGQYAWYNYEHWGGVNDVGPPIAHELEGAVADVFQLIEREYAIVGDYKRIAIAGLSQGGDLALEVGIRFPHQLGMVLSEQGILSTARRQGNKTSAAKWTGTPFILTAGEADEFSSPAVYKGSCASLQQLQGPVYLQMYPGITHGRFWKPEWELAVSAFSLMLNPNPKPEQIHGLTSWTPCDSTPWT